MLSGKGRQRPVHGPGLQQRGEQRRVLAEQPGGGPRAEAAQQCRECAEQRVEWHHPVQLPA